MTGIAINVGANTNQPGFRGPVRPDGTFTYLPIPESKPTTVPVPTYGDLHRILSISIPESVHETPVHLDPEFADYPFCERYTYGDDHGVKAGPLSELSAGEYVFFYATLSVTAPADWLPPTWGAFVIGHFRLAAEPVTGEAYGQLDESDRLPFENNAHVKRDPFDARVLLRGDPSESRLYQHAVPLSSTDGGTDANAMVTEFSSDSGKGPWWRRPLRFDAPGTERLLQRVAAVHDRNTEADDSTYTDE